MALVPQGARCLPPLVIGRQQQRSPSPTRSPVPIHSAVPTHIADLQALNARIQSECAWALPIREPGGRAAVQPVPSPFPTQAARARTDDATLRLPSPNEEQPVLGAPLPSAGQLQAQLWERGVRIAELRGQLQERDARNAQMQEQLRQREWCGIALPTPNANADTHSATVSRLNEEIDAIKTQYRNFRSETHRKEKESSEENEILKNELQNAKTQCAQLRSVTESLDEKRAQQSTEIDSLTERLRMEQDRAEEKAKESSEEIALQ
eukprot:gene43647-54631_t